jgi:hypothetical protein
MGLELERWDGWRVAAEEDRRPKASERRRSAAQERERI